MSSPLLTPPPQVKRLSASASLRGRLGRATSSSVWRRWIEPGLTVLAVLVVWELLARGGLVAENALPGVGQIVRALVKDLGNPELWSGIGVSVGLWLIGMAVVAVVTLPLGLLLGVVRPLYEASHVTVEFVRTIPSVAALPILVFVYGVSPQLTVALVILSAAWPLLIQTMTGAHDIDPIAIETARIYGLSRWRVFWQVVFPSALPSMVTGLKLAANHGLVIAIAASLVVGGSGLGALIGLAGQGGDASLLYARVVVAGALGLAVSALTAAMERYLLRWHPSQREAQ
ncbi:hypothetical protein CIC12_20800 [Burkholderia sp. SG-MS1]|uniref:ABC transporter permease n=1 Tax=Paraburkholderia sp. SG-MS1 TaxID=2023741 RepID=UPI001447F1BE|nr:ABC transporter permease [Paraburkholderia sp. SG-MS1]NKJ49128.1 hypothetical protein [Paraburkholderia sp. SG-MS1]